MAGRKREGGVGEEGYFEEASWATKTTTNHVIERRRGTKNGLVFPNGVLYSA